MIAAGFVLIALPLTATDSDIKHSSLAYECRLDDTPLLTVEVNLGSDSKGALTAEIMGLDCDRRITPLGLGKYKVEIAPDTSKAGDFQGQLELSVDGRAIGTPVPISGTVRPWIRMQPSRFFLGSIGKGKKFEAPRTFQIKLLSDTTPFDVKSVKLPDIAGATWKCDPPQGTAALEKMLTLEFSPDALAAGFPFGALAMKYLIVETTHSRASNLVLPIQGMISVNTTGRDYSQYLYNGTVRWEGRWATPNFAAAFFVTIIVFVCGLVAAIHARVKRREWRIGIAAVTFPAMAAGCWYLAATYSRGGWIALGIGIIALLIGTRSRFYPIGLAGLFALCVMLQPAGLDRASSTAAVTGDKSVSNRLLLWKGALQMMGEHPWNGVGAGKFGEVFEADYQLPTHKEEYTTAINDYLTFGSEWGFPLLILSMSSLLMWLGCGLLIGRQTNNDFAIACAAAAVAGLVCGWFSSILFQSDTSYFLLFACTGILLSLIWECWRGRIQPLRMMRGMGVAWAGCGIVLTAIFLAASAWALSFHPKTTRIEIAGLTGLEVSPRNTLPKGTIFYFADAGEAPSTIARSTLRALAQRGWHVYCFDLSRYASTALDQSKTLVRYLKDHASVTKFFIAGHRQGAQIALALAATDSFSGVGCYLASSQSAFNQLSLVNFKKNIEAPMLVAAHEADLFTSSRNPSEIVAALNLKVANKFPTHKGSFEQSNPRWEKWINDLDKFFSNLP